MAKDFRAQLLELHGRLPKVASLQAFLLAAAFIGIGVIARIPLDAAANQPLPPYITLYPAIVLSAFVGGIRVGFAAVVVSTICAWSLWMSPSFPWIAGSPFQFATALVYLCTASLAVATSGAARLLLDVAGDYAAERARAARESVHRIKNLVAVVQSISRKVAADATSVQGYRDTLDQRLRSLAAAQDVLLKQDWQDVDLDEIIRSALAPFLPNPRFEIVKGPSATLPRDAVQGVTMALYELATNSMKYGALADPTGFVRLEWHCEEGRCALQWREVGAENPSTGVSGGFGAQLIRSALQAVNDAHVRYEITPQAVLCSFDWPRQASA